MRLLLFLYMIFLAHSNKGSDGVLTDISQEDYKSLAFEVLREKCNACHATKKRTDIFTMENMNALARDINTQVFIKKKMPKGRKVKLTEKESKSLRIWLDVTLAEGQ